MELKTVNLREFLLQNTTFDSALKWADIDDFSSFTSYKPKKDYQVYVEVAPELKGIVVRIDVLKNTPTAFITIMNCDRVEDIAVDSTVKVAVSKLVRVF